MVSVQEDKQRFYLTEGEGGPFCSNKHKDHIEKVMFHSAIAHPRYDENRVCTFDGKTGIWPFIERTPALSNLIHRPAGTIITTNLAVTKKSYADMLINSVIPAIREKWPAVKCGGGNKTVYIQHGNASTHFGSTYVPFLNAATVDGWDIKLTAQPANSHNMNINDLSFFLKVNS